MCKLDAEASCVWNFKSLRLFQGKKYNFTFFVAENWAPYCIVHSQILEHWKTFYKQTAKLTDRLKFRTQKPNSISNRNTFMPYNIPSDYYFRYHIKYNRTQWVGWNSPVLDRHILNTDVHRCSLLLLLTVQSHFSKREFCPPFRSQTLKKALLSFHEELKELPYLFSK